MIDTLQNKFTESSKQFTFRILLSQLISGVDSYFRGEINPKLIRMYLMLITLEAYTAIYYHITKYIFHASPHDMEVSFSSVAFRLGIYLV